MNGNKNAHLDVDQIIAALVDGGDITEAQQRHLRDCPRCGAEMRRLDQGLRALEREARRMTPRPAVAVRLPDGLTGKTRRPMRWLPPAVALASAAVLLLVLWLPTHHQPVPTQGLRRAGLQATDDDALLSQIDALVEDALPAEYTAVIGLDDTPLDDLTQFIVPPVRVAAPLSSAVRHSGGNRRC